MSSIVWKKVGPKNFTPATCELFRFAAERQNIFYRRRAGLFPWTEDFILEKFKFTNSYRVLDRVSQFLVKDVIYKDGFTSEETFYRILLFKIFNKIETWQALEERLGRLVVSTDSLRVIEKGLDEISESQTIFSGAYIMPSGSKKFGFSRKHKSYLFVLKMMYQDDLHQKVLNSKSLKDVFLLLLEYPLIGPFLGFQFAIDLNYSDFLDFDEMDYVVAGPGALDGISKCFTDIDCSAEYIIRYLAECQDELFEYFGVEFSSLGVRKLQLIDWQNLLCETSKYTRVSLPHIAGVSGRTRIKQRFKPNSKKIDYFFPPKWGVVLPVV